MAKVKVNISQIQTIIHNQFQVTATTNNYKNIQIYEMQHTKLGITHYLFALIYHQIKLNISQIKTVIDTTNTKLLQ